jgi:hypothetical protein
VSHRDNHGSNLALYEQKFGPIRTPAAEAPLYPPEEPGAEPPG